MGLVIRFAALAGYTNDHVVMLQHAKALEAAARAPNTALAAAKGFHLYWENVLTDYLNECQDVVLPRLAEISLHGRWNKLTAELREATDGMRVFLLEGPMVAPFLPRVAAALHAYVQYAEGHMLPDLQNNNEDAGLDAIGRASLAYRKKNRPGAVGEPRTEKTYLPGTVAVSPPTQPRAAAPATKPPAANRAPAQPAVRPPAAPPPGTKPNGARPSPPAPSKSPPAPPRASPGGKPPAR